MGNLARKFACARYPQVAEGPTSSIVKLSGGSRDTQKLAEMIVPRSESPDDDRRYGLGFWLPAGGDAIQLEGYDAGISFLTTCRPSTGAVETVIANWTDGAWPIARFLREADTDG